MDEKMREIASNNRRKDMDQKMRKIAANNRRKNRFEEVNKEVQEKLKELTPEAKKEELKEDEKPPDLMLQKADTGIMVNGEYKLTSHEFFHTHYIYQIGDKSESDSSCSSFENEYNRNKGAKHMLS